MNRRTIVFGGISAVAFSALFALLFKWVQTGDPFRTDTLFYGMVFFVNLVIMGLIAYRVYRGISRKDSMRIRKHIIPFFLLFVLASLAVSLLLVSTGVFLYFLVSGLEMSGFMDHLLEVEIPGALKQFTVWIVAGSVMLFYVIWRKTIEREQKLRAENLEFRYRNLRSGVNPHFLFNSLNTLSELVYEDPAKADEYIRKLSGIYRYVLENGEKELIALEEELTFVNRYMELQEVRTGGKVHFETEISDWQEYLVVPVSLQVLVENALKHNVISGDRPLQIQIRRAEETLLVINNLQPKKSPEESTKKGLENLGQRVQLITGHEMVTEKTNGQFTVLLPLIRKPHESINH